MQDVKKPCGYGIVNADTGSVFAVWSWPVALVTIASVLSIVYNLTDDGPLTGSVILLCVCIAIIIFLSIVSSRVSPQVEAYRRWCRLMEDIANRKRRNQFGAISDAKAKIEKIRTDEIDRGRKNAARKYAELVTFNKGLPVVRGTYCCKRGEEAVYFESSVTFCEQRSDDGYRYWKPVDKGNLQITNKRIVFVGGSVNREIRVDSLSSTTGYLDGIEISQVGRVRPLLFKCHNGLLPNTVLKIIAQNPGVRLIPQTAVSQPPARPEVKSDVMEEFLDSLIAAADRLAACLKTVSDDRLSRNSVAKLMSQHTVEEFNWFNISDKAVGVCVVADLFRSFIRLGHDTNDLTCPEGLCLLLVLSRIFRCNRQIARDEWKKPDFRKSMDTMLEPYICKINEILPIDGQGGNLVLCDLLISGRQTRMSRSVASAMYEWAKIVAAADGSISSEEGLWLGVLRGYANGEDANTLRSGFTA